MKLYDFECGKCGNIHEEYITGKTPAFTKCPECKGKAKRIFTLSGSSPVDAAWISSMVAVVDRKSDKPHIKEFIRHPTRANMNTYLKQENLRHMDKAEPAFPKVDREARKEREQKQMLKMHQERNSLAVGSR